MSLIKIAIIPASAVVVTALWFANANPSYVFPQNLFASTPDKFPVTSNTGDSGELAKHPNVFLDVQSSGDLLESNLFMAEAAPRESEQKCSVQCVLTLALLQSPYPLSDAEFNSALATVEGLAEELKASGKLLQELIELAVTTSGNKRLLIISTFMLLDPVDRITLGQALMESPYRQQRLDGVQVLTNPSTLNQSVIEMLVEFIAVEQDPYVRSSVITALNTPDVFAGDQTVIGLLSETMVTDNNPTVRGEALLANANLTEQPELVFIDALNAIRSGEPDHQRFATLALEELIHRQTTQNGLELDAQNELEFRTLLTEIMNPEYDSMPDDVRQAMDVLYDRFF